jgi:hypothetical protein
MVYCTSMVNHGVKIVDDSANRIAKNKNDE